MMVVVLGVNWWYFFTRASILLENNYLFILKSRFEGF